MTRIEGQPAVGKLTGNDPSMARRVSAYLDFVATKLPQKFGFSTTAIPHITVINNKPTLPKVSHCSAVWSAATVDETLSRISAPRT